MTAEQRRLEEARRGDVAWKRWGPYLSERQWGTVREDYSDTGNAWDYFTHDQSRSRAYRWGEDGLAGISDDKQHLCFAIALWNGRDPILKERLYGLTNSEGNHGEDVKEYYFYLDSTPTHSYMRYLYKYPHAAFPYAHLIDANKDRSRVEMEYELLDTGIFDEDRYFDVFVEYAKASPNDILIRIHAVNRGPEPAELHILPTMWFRNRWTGRADNPRPTIVGSDQSPFYTAAGASDEEIGQMYLYCGGAPNLLFTENESNNERLFNAASVTPYVKDGINDFVVDGITSTVNPDGFGTKVAAHYPVVIGPGETTTLRLRLTSARAGDLEAGGPFGPSFDDTFEERRRQTDEFYASIIPPSSSDDERNVMRQALAGMMWSKQFYYFDLNRWLSERGSDPFSTMRRPSPRNDGWHHMHNADVISMPDKWEYPWYAAWDLAFHTLALSLVDPDFSKDQLDLMLRERYIHPNGQIPAYEWNFGDVNPPVHAWATIFCYRLEKNRTGHGDVDWLARSFQKLLMNFTWWVNRKDRSGKNVFEGGFLGLDNIGVFDRSSPLPTGGYLEQADGTAWMALFCQNMLEIAVELSMHDSAYVDMVVKFVEHFLWIASSMVHLGDDTGLWDEEDGFFYDVLRTPDGTAKRLKVRSMVGLLPLCAATVFTSEFGERYPDVSHRMREFYAARPEILSSIHDPRLQGYKGRRLASILSEDRLRRMLRVMLDENEFLGPYGIRSMSRFHEAHPYVLWAGGQEYRVEYLPAESDSGMFGGNSNWRGPVWMPVNALIVRALVMYYTYYGNDFRVECPTGSGRMMTLYEVAAEISRRLGSIFLRNENGQRPVYGGAAKLQDDPHWRDYVLFYEYFHGDNGAGLGASHQTGWTGTVARLMHLFAATPADALLEGALSTHIQNR